MDTTLPIEDDSCWVALLTPPGRGAIASIGIQGANAATIIAGFFKGSRSFKMQSMRLGQIAFGRWTHAGGMTEDLVLSKTSLNRFEVHCHGGDAAVSAVLHSLQQQGAMVVSWPDWALRNGGDPLIVEAHQTLATIRTVRATAIVLAQMRGLLRYSIEEIIQLLTAEEFSAALIRLRDLERYSELGLHLSEPWRVVFAGPPNVGKSSLINALLGYQRSIVDVSPGTTRDVVTATTAFDGWPVELADTAGLRHTDDEVEHAGVERTYRELKSADVVVFVRDASRTPFESPPPSAVAPKAFLTVYNKIDIADNALIPPAALVTNALTGFGIAELIAAMVTTMVSDVPKPDSAVPFTRRQAKAIQEAIQAVECHRSQEAAFILNVLLQGRIDSGQQSI